MLTRYTATYRFNRDGRHHHCIDIFNEFGRCTKSFSGDDPEAVEENARKWLSAQTEKR